MIFFRIGYILSYFFKGFHMGFEINISDFATFYSSFLAFLAGFWGIKKALELVK